MWKEFKRSEVEKEGLGGQKYNPYDRSCDERT
jgi:hypothetical protein